MSIRSIMFECEIAGKGIVNFGSKNDKWALKRAKRDYFNPLSFDNIKIAKHAYKYIGVDKDDNPIYEAVLKISRDCLRQAIFEEDQPFHNPGIIHAPKVLSKLLSSAAGLLRGYLFAGKVKRKSPVFISDAIQTSNNISSIDIGSMNAPKEQKKSEDSDGGLTMHYKESIGGTVTYRFEGALDLDELQFISLSQIYDRLAVDPNDLDLYLKNLSITLGSESSGKAFYIKKTAVGGLPEEGILLNENQVKVLVVEFFKRILNLVISRGASGRVELSSLKIQLKRSGLDKSDWIEVKSIDDVTNAVDSVRVAYDSYSEAEALKLYAGIEEGKIELAKTKTAKKAAKKATSKDSKE